MVDQLQFVTILVRDQDEAVEWYTEKLGMEKRLDIPLGYSRWLTVGFPGHKFPEIILQKPTVEEHGQEAFDRKSAQIGNGTTWVMAVTDCKSTVEMLRQRGVNIVEEAKTEWWGTMALIKDLYGNLFSLVERREP
jgi:catechol 2,3-dioxygenase-like lactoylglutathione lyase family enzyme